MDRTLYRSRNDRMISGVCAGIAQYFDIDPTLVRLLAVVLLIVSGGAAAVAYIVMAIVVPEEPDVRVEVGSVPEEQMGPGDMPEPGEFGVPQPEHPAPSPPAPPPPQYAPPPAQPYPPAQPPQAPAPSGRRRGAARGGIFGGVFLILLGVLFLIDQFVPRLDFGQLWPVILIVIGAWIIFGKRD